MKAHIGINSKGDFNRIEEFIDQITFLEEEQNIKFKMMDGIKFKRDHDIRLDHIELIQQEIESIRSKQDMLTDNETIRALKLMEN